MTDLPKLTAEPVQFSSVVGHSVMLNAPNGQCIAIMTISVPSPSLAFHETSEAVQREVVAAINAAPAAGSNVDQITAAAQLMLGIYNAGAHDRAAWERIIHATAFAAEAYERMDDRDWASGAMLRAFLTALADPASPDLDYLRAPSLPGLAPEPSQEDWRWWVGHDDERFGDDFATRDEAVTAAIAQGGGYIIRACKPANIKLSGYFDADEFLDGANENAADDHGDPEADAPIFDPSTEQQSDLESSVRAAIDAWQARHGLVLQGFRFASSERAERIDAPAEGGDA